MHRLAKLDPLEARLCADFDELMQKHQNNPMLQKLKVTLKPRKSVEATASRNLPCFLRFLRREVELWHATLEDRAGRQGSEHAASAVTALRPGPGGQKKANPKSGGARDEELVTLMIP